MSTATTTPSGPRPLIATERDAIMQRHGDNLAGFLAAAGLSRVAAARAMGVSRSTLGRIVNGTSPIRLCYLAGHAEVVGVDFFDLGMTVCGRTGTGQ